MRLFAALAPSPLGAIIKRLSSALRAPSPTEKVERPSSALLAPSPLDAIIKDPHLSGWYPLLWTRQ
jgi:hypothetical protein